MRRAYANRTGEMTDRLQVRLLPEMRAQLDQLAKAHGVTRGDVMRAALAAGLQMLPAEPDQQELPTAS